MPPEPTHRLLHVLWCAVDREPRRRDPRSGGSEIDQKIDCVWIGSEAFCYGRSTSPRGKKVAGNDLEAEPVFSLLENRYDTPLVEAEYKLEAAAADPNAAGALQVPTGSPIFLIERTSYTTENRPVDYERLHYRGDLIRFVTRLARRPRTSMQTGGP